jgi:serine protease Do
MPVRFLTTLCLAMWVGVFSCLAQEAAHDATTIETSPPLPADLLTQAPRNLEDLRLLEQHILGLLDKIRPATVALSGGSGVVVTNDGYVLTCAHVNQRPGRTVMVTFPDGKRVKGVTLGNDHGVDAGIVKITEPGEYPFVPLGNSREAQLGQWCLATGFPVSFQRGNQPAIRLGRIIVSKSRMIVSDCVIMGGDSGGPLFDLNGHVIGINSRVNNSLETNIHVPVDVYRDNWDRLIAGQDWSDQVQRSYIGITRDGTQERVHVSAVKPGSPAQRGGVQIGDIIVAFDQKPIENFDGLLELMGRRNPGDKVELTIERGGEILQLQIELAEWPQD